MTRLVIVSSPRLRLNEPSHRLLTARTCLSTYEIRKKQSFQTQLQWLLCIFSAIILSLFLLWPGFPPYLRTVSIVWLSCPSGMFRPSLSGPPFEAVSFYFWLPPLCCAKISEKKFLIKTNHLGNSENMACSDYNDLICKTCANYTNSRINLKCSQLRTKNSYLNYFIFFLKLIQPPLSVFSSSLGEFGSHFASELLDVISLSFGFVSWDEDWRRSSGIAWRGKLFFNLPKRRKIKAVF